MEPRNLDEMLEDESWIQVMKDRLYQVEKNDVWILVSPPQNKSIIEEK